MAKTELEQIEAGALNALASVIQSNSTLVEGFITSGQVDVKGVLASLIKDIPTVKGALALVAGPIEAAVESAITTYVDSIVDKYTPAQIVALVVAYLQGLATKV